MKLYSRGQLIFYSLASGLIVLLLAAGLGLFGPGQDTPAEPESVSAEEEPVFRLETNPIPPENTYLTQSSGEFTDDELANIRNYENLNRGVVNITTETLTLNWFLEPVPSEGGTGSGSIIDRRGYILTNYHVVEKAYKVHINLADGSQFEGEVIGKDPENDLAVVKFDPESKDLVTVPFGDSSNLRVGQKVLAIGNPFGYDRTLTTGIVSGLGRPVRTSSNIVIRDMIQTDASINPGNSGGPLLNAHGEMIGINTMIYSPSGGSVGIGFATPVNTARRVVPDLIEYGLVRRGWIDVVPVQLDRNIVRYGKLTVEKGILVSKTVKGGAAEKAGIRGGDQTNPIRYGRSILYLGGDILVEVDGDRTETISDLLGALEDNRPGEVIDVVAYRGRQKRSFQVELSERPEELYWN
ncbi:trypsin-like peptidase domain-containing protein [Marispirochaeta sp.]|jgi:S1-C subfamily serine protease|uniref:S1C family serine protease n=1 Tax=Marispirochaeta sp. TaxID=2038653 RepID=UPI0029C6CAAF|nr:trypsin-like peptidase domain-containing protein [Marispirochaeta sp.]